MIENKKNEIAITVGNRVRSIRRSKGLTIEQLACEIGVEYTQLSRIERGRINTSIFNLFLITKALNTSFSELVKDLDEVEFDLLGQ
jgi:transcriptional regulator with XRE-family HTH domain